jgi:hypothetical protein
MGALEEHLSPSLSNGMERDQVQFELWNIEDILEAESASIVLELKFSGHLKAVCVVNLGCWQG